MDDTWPVSADLVDRERLVAWMDEQGLGEGPLSGAELLGGGTQNILLAFSRDGQDLVLRRPPAHKRPNSDETLRREARVLAALEGLEVPHPALIAACPTTEVIGAAFTIMERVRGFNPFPTSSGATAAPPPDTVEVSSGDRHEMGLSLARTAAALGNLELGSLGLEGFGRPDGWLERQVPRWRAHLLGYTRSPTYPVPLLHGVDDLGSWLEANRPRRWTPGLIHGDCHLANVLFRTDRPEVAALVDWELATIGDPLMDLGWLIATWPTEDNAILSGESQVPWPEPRMGLPSPAEIVSEYSRCSRLRSVGSAPWYGAMACYKLGIILEGTFVRAREGRADPATGETLHQAALALIERGRSLAEGTDWEGPAD